MHIRVDSAGFIGDCSAYYRAVYEAIRKAKKSIFVVGWDIDSRIELLRGDDKPDESRSYTFLNIIKEKAQNNPEINFYLNKWKPALIYAKEREPLAAIKWHTQMPDNVFVTLDDTITSGGSHHQKIIVIDDRIAFSGGMDIALNRWDTAEHWPDNPLRDDAIGHYGPYHDFQILVEGDIVRELAAHARWRWRRATGFEPQPWSPGETDLWPENIPKTLTNFPAEIVYTFPSMEDVKETQTVEQSLIENIQSAENLIYIENQYLAYDPIAHALNEALQKKPALRVLILSSYDPQGPLEKETMWQGRIAFRKILEKDIERERVRMLYPVSQRDDGSEEAIRVHAKVMVIDDKIIRIGSANINGRSMGQDSECDIICYAETSVHKHAMRQIRNEAISRFTGVKISGDDFSFDSLLEQGTGSHLCVHEIDDSHFSNTVLGSIMRKIADRPTPSLPEEIDPAAYKSEDTSAWRKNIYRVLTGACVIVLFSLIWYAANAPDTLTWIQTSIESLLDTDRNPMITLCIVTLIYIALTTISFPITVLIALTATIYGSTFGLAYALVGSMASALTGFGIGSLADRKFIRGLFGVRLRKIDEKIKNSGVLQLALLRMVPIVPYGIFNIAAGVSAVKLFPFMVGTFLGMLPGTIALAVVGDSLGAIIAEASPRSIIYLLFALLLWIGVVYLMHGLVRVTQNRLQKNS